MATTANPYFLALAKTCESIAKAERGVFVYPHNHMEVMASCLQALLMTLGGAVPASTAMPPEIGTIGLTDLVQVVSQLPNLTFAAFSPQFAFGSLQAGTITGVAADGSAAKAITYASSFAFPTGTNQVLIGINNNYQSNPWILTWAVTSKTTTGFTLNVAGAPGASTVSIDYLAIGS